MPGKHALIAWLYVQGLMYCQKGLGLWCTLLDHEDYDSNVELYQKIPRICFKKAGTA